MPAAIELESGHTVVAMGTAAEVEAALCDRSVYDGDGMAVLRFAFVPALFRVDPGQVVGVFDLTSCDLEGP